MLWWTEAVLVAVVLMNLLVLGSSRLAACIRFVAVQGILLGILTFVAHEGTSTLRTAFLAIASIGVKGLAFPALLVRALREAEVRREIEPYVGYNLSMLLGLATLTFRVAAHCSGRPLHQLCWSLRHRQPQKSPHPSVGLSRA